MTYFNVMSIQYGGIIEATLEVGRHAYTIEVNPDTIDKQGQNDDEIVFKIIAKYTHDVNGKRAIDFHVVCRYLILGIDKTNLEKETLAIRVMFVKAVSHLQGIVAAKAQDNKWIMSPPEEPDYVTPTNKLRSMLFGLYK